MKHVEFIVGHGIDLLFQNRDRYEMSSRVDQQTAILKSRTIGYDCRIV